MCQIHKRQIVVDTVQRGWDQIQKEYCKKKKIYTQMN